MSKKSRFRGSSDMWHGKRAETLSKSNRQHLQYIYWTLWRQLRWKMSLLVICKILGLFVNPLTADNNYCLLNRGNKQQHFQMQLSQKRKIFFRLFFAFSKFRFSFEQLQEKDDPHSWCIFGLVESDKRG